MSVWKNSGALHGAAYSAGAPEVCEKNTLLEQFGDLHGVLCGAFEQVVGNDPHVECGWMGEVFTNATDVGRGFSDGFVRKGINLVRGVVLHDDPRCAGENFTCLLRR